MPRIFKVIWRLDYSASYAYLDKKGAALRILGAGEENFWNALGDGNTIPHSIPLGHSNMPFSEPGSRLKFLTSSSLWKSATNARTAGAGGKAIVAGMVKGRRKTGGPSGGHK